MEKKHYICTHTWSNPETIKDIIKQQGEMTDAEFFAGLKTERLKRYNIGWVKMTFFSVIGTLKMNSLS